MFCVACGSSGGAPCGSNRRPVDARSIDPKFSLIGVPPDAAVCEANGEQVLVFAGKSPEEGDRAFAAFARTQGWTPLPKLKVIAEAEDTAAKGGCKPVNTQAFDKDANTMATVTSNHCEPGGNIINVNRIDCSEKPTLCSAWRQNRL